MAVLAGATAAMPAAAHADSLIYSGPQNITADANSSNPSQTYTVELDGTLTSGFTFLATYTSIAGTFIAQGVSVTPPATGAYISGSIVPGSDPTPLAFDQEISNSSVYSTGASGNLSEMTVTGADQNWPFTGNVAYLGVTFTDPATTAGTSPNSTYYGWIALSATTTFGPGLDDAAYDITGWAYCSDGTSVLAGDTGPNACGAPLGAAPEPSCIGMLVFASIGVLALGAYRKYACPRS